MFSICGTVALNYREIESHPVSVSNIKRFINIYNCEGINYRLKTFNSCLKPFP